MKIKIEPLSWPKVYTALVFYICILIAGVLWLTSGSDSVLKGIWQSVLQDAREDSLFYFILLNIFPWALLFMAAAFVWSFFKERRAYTTLPRITSLSFEEKGVVLGQNLSRPSVFLPYEQTDFSLTALITITYNKYHQPIRNINGVKLSFSSPDGDFCAQHYEGLPFIRQMLNEGKKFRSCRAKARPAAGGSPSTQDEKDYIRFLEEQLTNYLCYGLMLTVFPKTRNGFLWLGIITACLGFLLGNMFLLIINYSPYPFLVLVMTAIFAVILLVCFACFKKYITEAYTAKKLDKAKQK